ncbi:hypothetical protein M440DRAFT_1403404 [Trichoderma longibrachiatum ATCC 18648]|uniref:Uncharacterized protein n=1 Tax=Trichoderma longibrachiatum ATCC 18648 TaxID=983965 RepID=A0A2T4C024_TRILO|nr:hypothetical protein M440DRAFT_1403404 [Trichoderma longibrachiatum ATCC 18648]
MYTEETPNEELSSATCNVPSHRCSLPPFGRYWQQVAEPYTDIPPVPVQRQLHCQVRLAYGKGLHPSTLAFGDAVTKMSWPLPLPSSPFTIACLTRLTTLTQSTYECSVGRANLRTHTQSVAGL